MPAKGRGSYQRSGESKLRARLHDFNSQRRNRNQNTITWANYKKITENGRTNYPSTRKK